MKTDFIICADETAFPEPDVGRRFWASFAPAPPEGGGVDILTVRTEQDGVLVFASVLGGLPVKPSVSATIGSMLGVPITAASKACDYFILEASEPISVVSLWDLTFETPTPVVVKDGTITDLQLDGHDYRVWYSAYGLFGDLFWVNVYLR